MKNIHPEHALFRDLSIWKQGSYNGNSLAALTVIVMCAHAHCSLIEKSAIYRITDATSTCLLAFPYKVVTMPNCLACQISAHLLAIWHLLFGQGWPGSQHCLWCAAVTIPVNMCFVVTCLYHINKAAASLSIAGGILVWLILERKEGTWQC